MGYKRGCHPVSEFDFDLLHDEEVGDTSEDRGGEPGGRVTENGERIGHRMHGDQCRDEPCEKLDDTAHHREEAMPAALHRVPEDEDVA